MRRPLAPYLPEANPNAPTDPNKAMAERQRTAIANAHANKERIPVERAGVDGAAPPPKASSSASTPKTATSSTPRSTDSSAPAKSSASAPAAQPSTEAGSTPSPSNESPTAPDATEAAASAGRGPRYDVKSMRKWAEEHPEEAAELRIHVFGADQDTTQEWVRVQNKKRKVKEELRSEREKTVGEAAAERAQAKADREAAEGVAGSLRPLIDMWQGATRKDDKGNLLPDFDTIDHAFEMTAQMPLDQYMRLRARRGVANPEGARLRAENLRLQRELEAAKGTTTGAAAPAANAGAVSPPAVPAPPPAAAPVSSADAEAKWGDDVPKHHKLRQIVDWASKLDAEMEKYHDADLDEYSRDPEDVAEVVLRRELAALTASEEDEPAPKKRAPPAGKPNTPRRRAVPDGSLEAAHANGKGLPPPPKGHKVIAPEAADEPPADLAERERWAIARARKRAAAMARGEVFE